MEMTQPAQPSKARAWLLAARPATLPAAIVPVLVGSAAAFATGRFQGDVFVAALLGSLLIQIGTNFANDLFDFKKGADTADRLGPTRVTQSGLITPAEVQMAMIATFAAAVLVGAYLVWIGGWPIVVIGVLSILSGIAYTGGPWPLGYHGLGDLFVFVFFGLVAVMGTYYLHAGTVTPVALAASIPVGLICTAILVVNNLRDIDTDRLAGKHTLATRLGRTATRWEYILMLGVSYAVPPLLWLTGNAQWWVLLPWLSLPLAWTLGRTVLSGAAGRALNPVLKQTGRLELIFGVLFALGLLQF
jgi:1,4-dihydroxy-2-naphthoate octaprenyltransferase